MLQEHNTVEYLKTFPTIMMVQTYQYGFSLFFFKCCSFVVAVIVNYLPSLYFFEYKAPNARDEATTL